MNLLTAIDWQHGKAEKLIKMISLKNDWYNENVTSFFDDWFNNVFSLDSSNDFGLSLWCLILDVPLFTIKELSKANISDEQKRTALKLKAFSIAMNGTSAQINKVCGDIFGRFRLYCFDGLDMTITYYTNDYSFFDYAVILWKLDLLPRPTGVRIKDVIYHRTEDIWGFGDKSKNFNRGGFSGY